MQVYRWIEGRDLSGSEGTFSSDLVIDIGVKLARALKLLWLLDPEDEAAADVQEALTPGLIELPQDRLTADGLLTRLIKLEDDRRLDQKRADAWRDLSRAAKPDAHLPWFWPVLRDGRAVLVAMSLGLHRRDVERFRTIADLLYKIGEASPQLKAGLRQLRTNTSDSTADPAAVTIALRHAGAHAGSAESDENKAIRQSLERLPLERQKDVVGAAIDLVGRSSGLRSLSAVLGRFL